MREELNVSVGDEVIVSGRLSEKIAKVERITPTGRIRVEGQYYDKYGWEIGSDVWSRSHITYVTEEHAEKIKQRQTISKTYQLMKNYNLNNLTFDQATKIIEIFEDKEK